MDKRKGWDVQDMKFTDWDFKVPVGIVCRVKLIVFRGFGLMPGVTVCGGRTIITVRTATVILLFGEEALRTGSKGLGEGGTV